MSSSTTDVASEAGSFSAMILKSIRIPTFLINALIVITAVAWTNAIREWIREVFDRQPPTNVVPESSIQFWFGIIMTGITILIVAAFTSDYFKKKFPNPKW